MTIKIYTYTSEIYQKELRLRDKILRKPLGLSLLDEDLSQDKIDIHIGTFTDKILVGVILLSPINDSTLKMRQVAVDENYQGQGIGTAMVRFCEQYAKNNSFKVITMHARENAINFYEKLGYETIGEKFLEVSIPHVKMLKNIYLME